MSGNNGGAYLRRLIGDIVCCGDDTARYDERNRLVLMALIEAGKDGLAAGIRIDVNDLAWPVVFIELPTGQVSWHIKQYQQVWDGHSTAMKWLRCAQYLAQAPPVATAK